MCPISGMRATLLTAISLCCIVSQALGQDTSLGSVYQQCNQTIYEGQGIIASPNFPSSYPGNIYCSWKIVVEFGRTVTLSFGYFDIERSVNCMYDKVTIYNGPTAKHPVLGRFCGPFRPGQLVSTSHQMLVTMNTDKSNNNQGFYAVFKSAEPILATPDSCGGLLVDPEGSFHSPNYPKSDYPPSVTCAWHIRTTVGRTINLYFEDFQVEKSTGCKYDSVVVYGGWSNLFETKFLGRFCDGMINIPSVISFPGNELFVTFVSDTSGFASGFLAKYATKIATTEARVLPSAICTDTTVLDSLTGELSSPGYGTGVQYANDLSCSWRIVAKEGARIQIRITDFNLEKDQECRNDYVAIYFGSDTSSYQVGRFCGSMAERSFMTTGNEMFIVFRTDSVGGEAGFAATYTVFLPDDAARTRDDLEIPSVVMPSEATTTSSTTLSTTTTLAPTPTTTTRPPTIFYECPFKCPPKIKVKTKICSANYIALVRISDIKTLRAQSIVRVDVVKKFKTGSLPEDAVTNLRIACRRCSNISRKGTYLIAGGTVTHEGIEVRPGDLSVRYKAKKHTKMVKKFMAKCRVRRHPRRGTRQKLARKSRRTDGSKKKSRPT